MDSFKGELKRKVKKLKMNINFKKVIHTTCKGIKGGGNMKDRLKDMAIKTHRKCIKVTINFK